MATITTRSGKGSPLTNTEVDNNFTNLNNAKYESGSSPTFTYVTVTGDTSGNEGGEVKLEGAGTNVDLFLDNFSSAFRVHSGGTTKLQVESTGSLLMREGGVFNNSSADSDFQVKSQNNSHMFFVNAGTDSVSIGTNLGDARLRVRGEVDGTILRVESGTNYQGLRFAGTTGYGNGVVEVIPSTVPGSGVANQTTHFKTAGTGPGYTVHNVRIDGELVTDRNAIFNEGGNNFDFRVKSSNNSDMLFVDANVDRVGIGYGSPQATLHVFHPINEGIRLQSPTANNSFGDENRIDFHMSNEVNQASGNPAARIASYLERNNNGYGLKFAVRENSSTFSTLMTLSSDMEVGIGTTTPGAELHVYKASNDSDLLVETGGSAAASLYLKNSENQYRIYTDNYELVFQDITDSRQAMKIDTHGNLVLSNGFSGPGVGTDDMRNILANAATEEGHFMHPFLNNTWGHFIERGGTVTVVGLTAAPSQTNLAKMFHSTSDNVGIYNSAYQADTIDIIMTDAPNNFTYGSYGTLTFGNIGWAPVSVTVYVSTDNGSTWTQKYTSTETKTNHSWYWSTGSTQTNALKVTLGRPSNNSYLRLNNLALYNYTGRGTENYHLPRRGGQLFGNLTVNELSDADGDFRVESNNYANMLLVDSSQNKVLINGYGSAVGSLHVYGPSTTTSLTGTTPSNIPFVVSNSDNGYGTMINQLGTGVGEIQARRTFSETYYGLSLSPYGGGVVINAAKGANSSNDAHLIVNSDHASRPALKLGSNQVNGFSLIGDNYASDETILNIGLGYSGGNPVFARSVKPSITTESAFISSQDTFNARPAALELKNAGFTFFHTPYNATTTTNSAVTLYDVFSVNAAGQTVVNEADIDMDFRVESTGQSQMLFVDAAENEVHINGDYGGAGKLNITGDFRQKHYNQERMYHRYINPRGAGDGTYFGYLLLTPTHNNPGPLDSTENIKMVFGDFYATRATTGSGNSWATCTVNISTGYNSDFGLLTHKVGNGGYMSYLSRVTYDGEQYWALRFNQTGGGPSHGVFFSGVVRGHDDNFLFMARHTEVTVDDEVYGKTIMSSDNYGHTTFNEEGNAVNFRVETNSDSHALFVDGANDRMEIGVPVRMTDRTAKIAWQDGAGEYGTYIGVTNQPTGGFADSDHTYWLDLRSKGGTHITLNTDGSRTSGRNTYDHFTVWQKAPDQTNGRACFSVDNFGNAYFANAGVTIDRGWNNYPSITVNNVSGNGLDNQASYAEFRVHGGPGDEDTWWGGSIDSDFSVNFRIDGGTYYSSDRRKKINIASLTNAVETVKQLDGVRFQIVNNAGTAQEHLSKSGYKMGFIAQDIEDVIPDAVKYYADEDDGTDGYNNSYSVDYGSVVALLTNAIKEQQATIEALEARIAALET